MVIKECNQRKIMFWRLAAGLLLNEILFQAVISLGDIGMMLFYQWQQPQLSANEIYQRIYDSGIVITAAVLCGLVAVVLLNGWPGGQEQRMQQMRQGETSLMRMESLTYRAEPLSQENKIHFGLRQFLVICLLIQGIQLFAIILSAPLDNLLIDMGYSLEESQELASGSSVTISMLLYSVVGAPVVEEAIYRGVVMRRLASCGETFALIVSSLFFALMHQNIVQLPVTFFLGLLFGCVCQRYGLWAAILFHSINNLWVEISNVLYDHFDDFWIIDEWIMKLSLVFSIAWLLYNRRRIAAFVRRYTTAPGAAWDCFSNVGILAYIALELWGTWQGIAG